MPKHGRRYNALAEQVEPGRLYQPAEAIELLKSQSTVKFDETVELHLKTNADPRHAEQMVRGVTVLPHGLGKPVRVLVFASSDAVEIAKAAGADYVGEDDLIERIEGGWMDFDVGLAVPQVMPRIGRLGRILGRSGLMPNPRSGTMVQPQDLPRVIREAKAGRLEYRTDRTAIIHCPVGKVSFTAEQLLENLAALVHAILSEKPDGIKGPFLDSAFLTTTMGPGISLDLTTVQALRPPE